MRRLTPLVLFGVIAVVYTVCASPDFTWLNMNHDAFGFFAGMSELSYWGAQPVYRLLGYLATQFPLGTDVWKVVFFLSVIPTITTCVIAFYAVKKQTINKYAPYVASAVFAASSIVISQATIVEVYSLATMLIAGAYLVALYDRKLLAVSLLGLSLGVHHMIALLAIVVFAVWKRDLVWYYFVPAACFVGIFVVAPIGGAAGITIDSAFNTAGFVGGLRLAEIPTRLLEAPALVLAMGGLAWLPALLHFRDWRKSYPLLIIVMVPVLFASTCEFICGYVQMYLSVFFLAIAAGLGVEKLRPGYLTKVVLVASAITLLVTPAFWDIGRTLDTTPTTARQWLNQLEELPDGSFISTSRWVGDRTDAGGAMACAAVSIANRESSKTFYYVFPTFYVVDYMGERSRLQNLGFETPVVTDFSTRWELESFNMNAFAEANGVKVYYTDVVNAGAYESIIKDYNE